MVGDEGGYAARGRGHSPYTKGNLGRSVRMAVTAVLRWAAEGLGCYGES